MTLFLTERKGMDKIFADKTNDNMDHYSTDKSQSHGRSLQNRRMEKIESDISWLLQNAKS